MKTTIEVSDRKEGDTIRLGLSDPAVRAFVKVVGALGTLSSDRARERVMRFVRDQFEEQNEEAASR